MTKRLIAAAAALTLGLTTFAQAETLSAAGNQRVAPPNRGTDFRAATYNGGEVTSWNAGRDTRGFSGTYGGCRYFGHVGPDGYRLDRSC